MLKKTAKCKHCNDTKKQQYVHNTWDAWQNQDNFQNLRAETDAMITIGPCHYCTPYKWVTIEKDNVVKFFDNEQEAIDYEDYPRVIMIHRQRSFEEKG